MNPEIIQKLHGNFESAAQRKDGVQFWYARDIQQLLEYTEWRNFQDVIEKAKIACRNSKQPSENHFVDVNKMVDIGSGATREVKDVMLTRYGCYLIAQNGDPKKDAIAFAQSYFAVQTRKQELLQERMQLEERLQARWKLSETERQLSSTLYNHGVDKQGFGIVRSKGDNALFGGLNTNQIKQKLGIKGSRALADFLPTVTLKAKEFAAAITDFNVKKFGMHGVESIGNEHVQNNKNVRDVLKKSDIYPEKLPPEEDTQKLERRVESEKKRLLESEGDLKQILNEK